MGGTVRPVGLEARARDARTRWCHEPLLENTSLEHLLPFPSNPPCPGGNSGHFFATQSDILNRPYTSGADMRRPDPSAMSDSTGQSIPNPLQIDEVHQIDYTPPASVLRFPRPGRRPPPRLLPAALLRHGRCCPQVPRPPSPPWRCLGGVCAAPVREGQLQGGERHPKEAAPEATRVRSGGGGHVLGCVRSSDLHRSVCHGRGKEGPGGRAPPSGRASRMPSRKMPPSMRRCRNRRNSKGSRQRRATPASGMTTYCSTICPKKTQYILCPICHLYCLLHLLQIPFF